MIQVNVRAAKSLVLRLNTLKVTVVLEYITSLTKLPLRILVDLNETGWNMCTFHAQIFYKLGNMWISDDKVFWFVLAFHFAEYVHAIDGLYRDTSRHKCFI